MKGFKNFIAPKTMVMIQSIICLVVMLVIVFLSFGTIFTATMKNSETVNEKYNEIMDMFDFDDQEQKTLKMPERVDVSAPFIIKSVGTVASIIPDIMDMISDAGELVNDANNVEDEGDAAELEGKVNETKESAKKIGDTLRGESFAGLIALIVVIVEAFGQSVILGIIYIVLIITALVFPIVASIKLLIALISFLVNIKNPGKGYAKVCKSFRGVFVMIPVLWLYKILAPELTFGAPITAITVLCFVVMAINLVASRLKSYSDAQFKYINVLQAVSLASIIGYVLFITNVGKIEIFSAIWNGLADFISGKHEAVSIALTVLAIIVMIIVLFAVCKYIAKIATRFCCMVPVGKKRMRDTHLAATIFALLLVAAPIYLMKGDYKLNLDDTMSYFVASTVGIVLMFACEVFMVVAKKTLLANVTADDKRAVLTGCPTGDEEIPEETAAEEADEQTEQTEEEAAEAAVTEEIAEEAAEEAVEEASEEAAEEAVEEAVEEPVEEAEEKATEEVPEN